MIRVFPLKVEHLEINKGDRLVLVGPSGSGKSTLLRLLNFLEPPSSGSIIFENEFYNKDKMPPLEARRRVTTVFQNSLLLSMSVLDNVCWGLRLRKVENPEDSAMDALAMVGMAGFAEIRSDPFPAVRRSGCRWPGRSCSPRMFSF